MLRLMKAMVKRSRENENVPEDEERRVVETNEKAEDER